jgi:putative nucleotidyltransferase with HDIG domain
LKEVQYAPCIDERHDISYPGIVPHGHYCIPIETEAGVLGVLNFYIEEGHARSEKEVEFLKAVSAVLAGIIEHLRVQEKLKDVLVTLRKALGGTIEIVASMVERRDPYTAGHQRRVANLARAIATEMGLSQDQIDAIRLAGVIHDLGKISVPVEILTYPGKLGDVEMALIKRHPDVGYETLKMIDFPWPLAQIVRQHHERMDGSGYPLGLTGKQIMPEARVLCVADVVEAMVTHRPYRPALGLEKALDEISRNRGILYDTMVVDAALKLLKEKGFQIDREVKN